MRSKWMMIVLVFMLCMVSGCSVKNVETNMRQDPSLSQADEKDEAKYILRAYVQEVSDTYMLVVPTQDSIENATSSLFFIDLQEITEDCLPRLGDMYEIVYDGMIEETYPAKLSNILEVRCVQEASELSNMDRIKLIEQDTYHALYGIDIDALNLVFTKYEWEEGTSDCLSEYELVIDDVRYVYHEDCGTFNDLTHQKSIQITEEDQEYVLGLLEQFVSVRQWSSGPMVHTEVLE
ncbi:MAG: hypothetical protein E7191_04615 [Erysipelotrichaceae bacterium]|nr:hypothetical protein [Erysipelotrichaceae bacterium]